MSDEQAWVSWSEMRPPDPEANYWWRVDPREIDGIQWRPEWTDKMHLCGMGYSDSEYWPPFSHWDGYRRTVPKGTQWRAADDSEIQSLTHNLSLDACHLCGASAKVKWSHRSGAGGLFIGSAPFEANEFAAKCSGCGCVDTGYTASLSNLLKRWNRRAPAQEGMQKALNAARLFIEDEYRDPSVEPEGEWLAKEARAIHSKICDALSAPAEPAGISERLHTPTPWRFVGNSWRYTTIYDAEDKTVCRLDLEDWAVTEKNQSALEREQSEVATRIVRAVNGLSEVTKELRAIIRICNHSEQLDECQKLTSVELASTISNRARKALGEGK